MVGIKIIKSPLSEFLSKSGRVNIPVYLRDTEKCILCLKDKSPDLGRPPNVTPSPFITPLLCKVSL